jgi:transcriptional regulator with GAF, ATPase, and Fis domain
MAGGTTLNKHRTGVSSSYGTGESDEERDRAQGGPTSVSKPGLVLLYAPNFDQFAPAYVFGVPELILGRDAANQVCIPEQAVSRQHARIAYHAATSVGNTTRPAAWVLTDLGSRNGTMVDGAFVKELPLEHLQELRIGDAIFKFVEAGAERYVSYRLDGMMFAEKKSRALDELVGGAQMDAIAADIERIAPTELSCLVLGDTGTGKEVAARGIHRLSGRKGSFQAVNCAAIPHNLLESELFGYRRGAFSGADRDKPGLVKLADGGTLFLDEIGDMPLEAQAKLLRVLQMREVFPLGGTTPEKVDIRVVCATHRDLHAHVTEGKFRGDLFARLNEHVVRLPPLRERKEDVYRLAKAFATRYGQPELTFTFSAMVALLHYDWPFNVRELESCIKRGVALTTGGVLDTPHLPDAIATFMKGYGEKRSQAPTARILPPFPHVVGAPSPARRASAPTAEELRALLERHKGNVAAVGRELGKERMQIHRWLKKYEIDLDRYRAE